ncbi:zonadhesin-like [Physeter macrocephalus]|uniref:Zonadhesin-like n=1 Tax=Physeter macrocephalus TaxID=9755 RepID=A0A9W2X650_PHYMC|nr:zonadhesin-like [Physeter catodon]XP_054946823.1 zonadhesin-like [Physeter catodon]
MTYFLIKTLDVLPDGVEPLVVEGRNKVDGQKMAIPYEPNHQLRVTVRGHRLYLVTDFELVISFNGKNNAVISPPVTYAPEACARPVRQL